MSKLSQSQAFIDDLNKPTPEIEREFFFSMEELAEAAKLLEKSLLDKPKGFK